MLWDGTGHSATVGQYCVELNTWRFGILWLCSLPAVIYQRLNVIPERKDAPWLFLYCLCNSTFNLTYYEWSIYLPVMTGGGLEASLVIVWIAIITLVITRTWTHETTVSSVVCNVCRVQSRNPCVC